MIKAWKIQDGSALDFKFWIEISINVDSVRANLIFKFITGNTTETNPPVNGTSPGNIIPFS